jgi:hypothetical protein
MLLSAARNIFDKNIVDNRDPAWVLLITSALAITVASHAENLLERPAMPAYARSHIVPPDEVGVYHCMARWVRRAFLRGVDPLTTTITTIARNGSANDSSSLHRFSRSISAAMP